jgi:hypothetical protein
MEKSFVELQLSLSFGRPRTKEYDPPGLVGLGEEMGILRDK